MCVLVSVIAIVGGLYFYLKERNEGRCKKCKSGLIVFKVLGRPNWEWCPRCDAVYDESGQYQGILAELEDNGTLEEIENQACFGCRVQR